MAEIVRFPLQLLNEENARRTKRFFAVYISAAVLTHPDEVDYLGTKSPRRCRFCGLAWPDVKFGNAAHVLPQFMGNRNVLSWFECNNCNDRFSRYESSFAQFIKLERTLGGMKGRRNRIPEFEDDAGGIAVKPGEHSFQLIIYEDCESVFTDHDNKELKIKTVRPDYVPIHILKTIVKIGLSLLDDDEVTDYEIARQFIMSDEYDLAFAGNPMLRVYGYWIPGPTVTKHPNAALYGIDNACAESVPAKQLILNFGNYCLQMVLPFGRADKHLSGKKTQVPLFPLLIDPEWLRRYGDYQMLALDLTSAEWQKGEKHQLTMAFSEWVPVSSEAM